MKNPFTKIAAVIFGVIALIHLCRLLTKFSIVVMGTEFPIWMNIAGVIVASILSVGLWRESEK